MEMQTRPKWKQLRMVGYGRVSTDEEKQLYSLENQLMFLTNLRRVIITNLFPSMRMPLLK